MTSTYLLGFFTTFFVSIGLVATKRWHGHLSMDSMQGVQKLHLTPTPRIGGVAVAIGLTITAVCAPNEIAAILWPTLVASLPAFLMGLIEDITKKIGPLPRLFATMLSGLFAWALTGTTVNHVGVIGIDFLLSYTPIAVAFTMVAVAGLANSINIIDGFNGLASGVSTIILIALASIAAIAGDMPLAMACFTVAFISLGFMLTNWPYGKIFLGDGGAYLLGFLIAWLAILLPYRNTDVSPWASLLACSYPVIEVTFSIRRRTARKGHHPGQPDCLHFHHLAHKRLVRKIFRHTSKSLQNGLTSFFMWAFAAIPAISAVLFFREQPLLIASLALAVALYVVFYARLATFRWPKKIRL